eukprot:1693980-Pyramimonas_sp.AAC.1
MVEAHHPAHEEEGRHAHAQGEYLREALLGWPDQDARQQVGPAEPTARLSEGPPSDGRDLQRAHAGGEGQRVEPTHLHHGRRYRGGIRP